MYYYLNILKKLSLFKVLNYTKLLFGYYLSKNLQKNFQNALPVALSIEPTTSCNLRCPQCPSGLRQFTRETGMLQNDLFNKVLNETKKHVFSINFYFQGEPYLNTNFLKMVKTAHDNKVYTITSTNAHYLNESNCIETIKSGLDEIIISIDGVQQETYEQYRIGGDLDKVLKGAATLIETKKKLKSKTPFVVFQFVVFKFNEKEVSEVEKLGLSMGADKVNIKTAQIYDFENSQHLIPENSNLARYKKNKLGKWEIKNPLKNQCWRMWQGCVITWDGNVVPCCFDKDAKYKIGNLKTQRFKEVWFSEEYSKFRNAILKSRKEIDICTNCTEGTKVFSD